LGGIGFGSGPLGLGLGLGSVVGPEWSGIHAENVSGFGREDE
jgi:hypothetical protein